MDIVTILCFIAGSVGIYLVLAYLVMIQLINAGAYFVDGYDRLKLFCRPVSYIFEKLSSTKK